MTARPNRRTALRHARRMKVPCTMKRIVEDPPFPAHAMIVTAAAVRVVVPRSIPVGTFLAVDLADERGRVAGQLFRVSLAREGADGEVVLEGTFSKKLNMPDVVAMSARLGPSGWKTLCRVIHVRHEGPWLATMHNVSRSGIGLISDRLLDPGSFLEISLPSIRRKHLQPKLVRVVNSKRQEDGDGWVVGGVFLRALTEEELQVLL